MNEQRLFLSPGALTSRFCTPGWRAQGEHVPFERIVEQARAIDPARCQRLVFTGGRALSHPDFERLVRVCGELGLKNFVLETDAPSLAEPDTVERLSWLGFTELHVVVGGVREKVHEFVMQDPGSFAAAVQGIRNATLGLPKLYVTVPLLRANADDVEPLLAWLLKIGGHVDGFLLSLPEFDSVPEPARKLLLPYSELAKISAKVFRAAQGNRIEYGFATKRGLTPCATDGVLDRFGTVFHDRFNWFKHAKNERLQRVAACEGCSLTASCNGVEQSYLRQFGEAEFKTVPLDVSMNWKLRKFNLLEKFDYNNISPFKNDAPVDQRGLIRINGHCNMSCSFCFVDRTAPDFEAEGLLEEIERMSKLGINHLVLSGGEPTLHPDLVRFIARGKELGFKTIEIQTNGVHVADPAYAERLVAAGLNKATVSLHSVDPKHSDEITRLPGAFPKTLEGMRQLRRLGVLTQVAHVITKANYKELPQTVRFLREQFPASGGHLSICFAIAQGISDLVFHWVIPTYSEIKPYFKEALDYCLETGIGFGGMIGQGGYPPCMLDGDMRYYEGVLDKVFKSEDAGKQFYKSEKCRTCDFDEHCLGPRRAYVQHYGDDEITPFELPERLKQRLVELRASAPAESGEVRLDVPTLAPTGTEAAAADVRSNWRV